MSQTSNPIPPSLLAILAPISKSAQSAGKQPSFITGSYPDATWAAFNDYGGGMGVYLPYVVDGLAAAEHPEWVTENNAVNQQYGALLATKEQQISTLSATIPVPGKGPVGGGSDPATTNLLNQILGAVQQSNTMLTAIKKKVGA